MSNYYKQLAQFRYFPQFRTIHPLIKELHHVLLNTFNITSNLFNAFRLVFWENVERYCTFNNLTVEIASKFRKLNIKKIVKNILYS